MNTALRQHAPSSIAQYQAKAARTLDAISEVTSELLKRESDRDRMETLEALHGSHPQFIDLEAELNRCLRGRGSDMGEEQFGEHIEMLEEYAQRFDDLLANQAKQNKRR